MSRADESLQHGRPAVLAARLPWGLSLLVFCLLAAGCSDPGGGCHPCFTEAVAFGRVTDAGGFPVEGLVVHVGLSAAPCTDTTRIEHGFTGFGRPKTDSTGRYRSLVHSPFSPFTAACADVTANVLEYPEWTTVTGTFPTTLEFREEGMPLDSARFDMVVEARSGG